MSEDAFTPGPWRLIELESDTDEGPMARVEDERDLPVTADLPASEARLIAAAPEIYELLMRIIGDRDFRTVLELQAIELDIESARKDAHDLLAKIRGEA